MTIDKRRELIDSMSLKGCNTAKPFSVRYEDMGAKSDGRDNNLEILLKW